MSLATTQALQANQPKASTDGGYPHADSLRQFEHDSAKVTATVLIAFTPYCH